MFRNYVYNKLFRSFGLLIVILLFILFPVSNKYELEKENIKNVSKINTLRNVYLLDKYNYVSMVKVNINDNSNYNLALKLIELLKIDGKYNDVIPNGFRAILPDNLKVNNIKIDKNKIYVDFSNEFNNINKNYYEKAIELLTFNLTSIENIDTVFLSINNKLIKKEGYKRSDGVNKLFKLSNIKNINKTTIYFLNKNKAISYYVPVTKFENTDDDKIDIIINELASSYTYQPLKSFMNYKTKLLDYKLKNDILTLNFNKYIFDNEKENKILEEVIYTILYSINDNYNIKDVVFLVNNNKILKSSLKIIE